MARMPIGQVNHLTNLARLNGRVRQAARVIDTMHGEGWSCWRQPIRLMGPRGWQQERRCCHQRTRPTNTRLATPQRGSKARALDVIGVRLKLEAS